MALDDPADTYHGLRGERTPLGFDLEWETDGIPFRWPGIDRYEIPCRVHGEILVGDERIEFEGPGQRDHSWGERDWWSTAWCWTAWRMEDGTRYHAVTTLPSEGFAVGYAQPGAGADGRRGSAGAHHAPSTPDPSSGGDGIPTSAELEVAGPGVHGRAAGVVAGPAGARPTAARPGSPGPWPASPPPTAAGHRLDRVQPTAEHRLLRTGAVGPAQAAPVR